MSKPSLGDLEMLMQGLVLPFYEVIRDISAPIKQRRLENDAEHSWTLALMACALAPEVDSKLDVGKVCMYATVHDVVEIYAGDTSVWSMSKYLESKPIREARALKMIEKKFHKFSWLIKTIKEYESKASAEAKFVYAMDKFVNNLLVYADKNLHNVETRKTTLADFDRLILTHRPKAHSHSGVAEYYDQLITAFRSHPEYFHPEIQNGK